MPLSFISSQPAIARRTCSETGITFAVSNALQAVEQFGVDSKVR